MVQDHGFVAHGFNFVETKLKDHGFVAHGFVAH